MRLSLLWMEKLSHTCPATLASKLSETRFESEALPLSLPVWPELCPPPPPRPAAISKAFMARLLCTLRHKHRPTRARMWSQARTSTRMGLRTDQCA